MIDVSVIIVNYKTSHLIIDCLISIINFTKGINYEIIIVDNNSEKDFKEKINGSLSPQHSVPILYLALPKNIGFGRANNEAVKISKGRNVFFLNPDTLLLNNAIKLLSDFLDSHPKAGACGGNLFDEKLSPTYSFRRFLPGVFWEINEFCNTIPEKIIFHNNSFFNHSENVIAVGFISGADLMVKRKVIDLTLGFSKEYFLYFEETDLCYRIKKEGWEIYNIPCAKIQHLESKSFSETTRFQNEFKIKCIEKGRQIFYKLNKKGFSKLISLFIYKSFLVSRSLIIKDNKKKEYYKLRKKYFNSNEDLF